MLRSEILAELELHARFLAQALQLGVERSLRGPALNAVKVDLFDFHLDLLAECVEVPCIARDYLGRAQLDPDELADGAHVERGHVHRGADLRHASDLVVPLEDQHILAVPCEVERRGHACEPGAYDDDFVGLYCHVLTPWSLSARRGRAT